MHLKLFTQFKYIDKINRIGSVNCLGSFTCYIIYGYLISAVGSKIATLLLTIPSVLGWSLIYFGDNYYYILIGRFLGGGVSGAATVTVSLYVTEISNDEYGPSFANYSNS